jgi:hypothetical protein
MAFQFRPVFFVVTGLHILLLIKVDFKTSQYPLKHINAKFVQDEDQNQNQGQLNEWTVWLIQPGSRNQNISD